MNMRPRKWLVFSAAFCALHLAFWLFVAVRDMASNSRDGDVDMGILGGLFIGILFGPLTGAKCAIGYALVDSTVGAHLERSALWHRYDPVLAGFLAAVLLLVGLSLREALPNLSNNLADSYFGGNLLVAFRVPWDPILLGSLSGALTTVVGTAVNSRQRGPAPT